MPDLGAAIKRESVLAKLDDVQLASFDALRLNLGTADTVRSMLLNVETWKRIEGDAPMDGRCYWGMSILGTSAAQSAITASYWPDSGRLECIAAFPDRTRVGGTWVVGCGRAAV